LPFCSFSYHHYSIFEVLKQVYCKNNRAKNDKEFGEWLNSLTGIRGPSTIDIPSYSALHLIPNESKLWESDNFDDFLEKRKTLIICKIKENLA
jgi:hypothetical protein